MSYSIVGFLVGDCTIMCPACTKRNMSILEFDVAMGYADTWEIKKWPRRDKYGEVVRSHKGSIVMDKIDWFKHGKHVPMTFDGDEVSAIFDYEEWLDGLYCDCGAEMIEPYTVECRECHNVLASGEEALEFERDFDFDHLICADCLKKEKEAVSQKIADRAHKLQAGWYYFDRNRLIGELRNTNDPVQFQANLLSAIQNAVTVGWNGPLTINLHLYADMLDIVREEIEDADLDIIMEPADFEVWEQDKWERIRQARQRWEELHSA